ncbi:heavy metal sensor histidine kinase [Acinetobacter sp. B51(2017)]|uniref:heavy metal sensor histidine kinase n=1 Tax=Acinetobacter sp. B51(2017) TaxID=2060938 RepID=UPI000F08F77F|nr:heavy metal sensor histidine kinase [Acinetobacter sp. B51(2017)]
MKRSVQLPMSALLALSFGLICCVVFSSIAWVSDQNMQRIIQTQQDQALTSRLERIEIFLQDQNSLNLLIQHPKLYENMLGQQDNLLILYKNQQPIITINPLKIDLPSLHVTNHLQFQNDQTDTPSTRLAFKRLKINAHHYTLIAGKQLAEGQQILASYRQKLLMYSVVDILLSTLMAWLAGRYILKSMRQLIQASAEIHLNHHDSRFSTQSISQEVNKLTHSMNRMLDRLDMSYQQLARFSEDIAHELRTPLNNLIGQTQIVLSHSRTQDDLENLLYSHLEEYERLHQMIESMLLIARLEHGEYQKELTPIALPSMLNDLVDYFSFLAEDKQIQMQVLMPPDVVVLGHAVLVERALANLISNAIDHGVPQSQVKIQVDVDTLNTRVSVFTPHVQIEARHLAHLFERFYQVENSRHASGRTGGLGLAIVKSIMQIHQGKVQVENLHDGVVFRLIFPHAVKS